MMRILLVLAFLIGAGCSSTAREKPTDTAAQRESALVAALARYEGALRRMDFEEVARCFAESGEMSTVGAPPVQGRAAIRAFLEQFADFKILELSVHAEHTAIDGVAAQQSGTYTQTVVVPGAETVHVHGQFDAS